MLQYWCHLSIQIQISNNNKIYNINVKHTLQQPNAQVVDIKFLYHKLNFLEIAVNHNLGGGDMVMLY